MQGCRKQSSCGEALTGGGGLCTPLGTVLCKHTKIKVLTAITVWSISQESVKVFVHSKPFGYWESCTAVLGNLTTASHPATAV